MGVVFGDKRAKLLHCVDFGWLIHVEYDFKHLVEVVAARFCRVILLWGNLSDPCGSARHA